nr:PREDICTED: LOW QUALITY PROTEIN: AP-5 complex subunit beta-1 [Anolis carolinensis]|eukprot:XP_016854649.1 PREDICTED: LOW QUALITY PROTEIN: AP-5 complex subunit beta-1 [Anolis carolinensis]
MGSKGTESWPGTVASFRAGPSAFLLSRGASEAFVAEILRELHGDRSGERTKLSLLMLLLEFPRLLCPDPKAGQEAAASLVALFARLGPSPAKASLRRHLLFAAGTVLVATEAFAEACPTSRQYLALLLRLAADLNDQRGGPAERPVRMAACECLRELEAGCPGLLSGRLEALRSFQRREASPAHQGYALLYGAALRNGVLLLAKRGTGSLGGLLAGKEDLAWGPGEVSAAGLDRLVLLPSPGDLKELKSVVSALLDGSFSLSPAAQSHLLWHLAQAVSVVRTQSPAIFKAQLVRLFGTADVALQHAILQLKALFTDSLFTAEDEAFLLRRLVGHGTVLARLNLLCLVCVESEGPAASGSGLLLEHVLALGGVVAQGGRPEGRAALLPGGLLFASHFGPRPQPIAELTRCVLRLYRRDCSLAPNVINLLDEAWGSLEDPGWAGTLARGLQELIVGVPLREGGLGWHLTALARLAREKDLSQGGTVRFLGRLVASGQLGDWRSGQMLLRVCRNLMQLCRPPDLADLLQAVPLRHADTDVQDQARFYSTLLANLSGEKLGAVLAREAPAKARTLSSSIVADSESFVASLTVHPVEPAPLELRRAAGGGDGDGAPAATCPALGAEDYSRWLLEARPPSRLRLACHLAHVGPRGPPFDLLLCVALRFSCSDRHYGPVPELCVPCLSAHRPPQALALTLAPRCPFPTRLDVSAVYTTREGLTRCSRLGPVQVAFCDLFVPLPVPAWPLEKRQRLFAALWDRLCPENGADRAESVTVWPVPPRPLDGLMQSHFARYLLAEHSGRYEVGLALPPRCHVLLRVQSVAESARVGIRTDNWKILPSLNSYLQGLVGAA